MRRYHRRNDEALPPARRRVHLRRTRAHGPGLGTPQQADSRPGKLRLHLRPAARCPPLYRSPPGVSRGRDAHRSRPRDGRLHRQLRWQVPRAARAAGQVPEPARERGRRHRGRHGHPHPAAQLEGNLRRAHPPHRQPRDHALRLDLAAKRWHPRDDPGTGLPHRRHHHGPSGVGRWLPRWPRQDHLACSRRDHRGRQRQDAVHSHSRSAFPGHARTPAPIDDRSGEGRPHCRDQRASR